MDQSKTNVSTCRSSSPGLDQQGLPGPVRPPMEDKEVTEEQSALEVTFDVRRHDVVVEKMGVRNFFIMYPGLRDFKEIRREFERINKKSVDAFEHHLEGILKNYAEGQLAKENFYCTKAYCKDSIYILTNDQDGDGVRKNVARMIIYACGQSENTWWGVIFNVIGRVVKKHIKNGERRLGRTQPTVIIEGSPFDEKCAEVYCEKELILKGINFYQAMLTCYYLYYVFNIKFPRVDLEVFKPFEDLLNMMTPQEKKQN